MEFACTAHDSDPATTKGASVEFPLKADKADKGCANEREKALKIHLATATTISVRAS